ncbi:fumarylacetoacetate hydrolase family protein [Paenarthrobacter nitroguajacolicus]|uniref:fumarylacetoacetate hydrolase family protein n=1 Tax=Paenarthrobacter nitroguajacolicus TaxID=211146 RepID=UPI000A6DA4EC|nr:fumarylacetoacetate hydrolase family protein [Paenarthrobacter nitroguajacolicus]
MTQIARVLHNDTEKLVVPSGSYFIDAQNAFASWLRFLGDTNASDRAAGEMPHDSLEYFRGGHESYKKLRQAVDHAESVPSGRALDEGILFPRDQATLLVPIPNPPKIVCVARNFGKHAAEAGLQISEIPILFPRFANTQIADEEPIIVPTVSAEVDWEGELAVVIGVGGHRISHSDAMAHVAGYTVFNDVSVRDYQFRVTQYTGGKNFRASGPVGPHISLVDEGIDPHNARITTVINGEVKQDATTEEFIFDIPTIIEHISEFIPLEPGDIIPMGTPAGVGFKRNPPEFLRPGDLVEVTVAGIGTLRNPVVDERHYERTQS